MDEISYEHHSEIESMEDSNQKSKQYSREKTCAICTEPSLQILINNALYHKHQDAQNLYYVKYIDNIMDGQICEQTVLFREMGIRDDQQQFMRRMYNLQQYEYKNKAITQYYKFHQDYPKLHQLNIDRIMQRHYDKKKQYEYKKIKRVLKQEENISITTQKSSQVFSDIQEQQKRSNYSNVLNDLTQNGSVMIDDENQSNILKQMCKKIDKAYQNRVLSPLNYRANSIFDQNNQKDKIQVKKFVNYLKKQNQKKQKQEKYKNFIRSNKQSRYNSIEHDSKQYASGAATSLNIIKNMSKKQAELNNRKNPFFYDGKMFFNGASTKGSILSHKKQQKTKQQTNTPSHQNFDLQINSISGAFKKNKQSKNNSLNRRQIQRKGQQNDHSRGNLYDRKNSRTKMNQKTTQQIYKNATQDLKMKKRSISYNSLANTLTSKRNSILNLQVLKQKDFQIRNRSSSNGKNIKQRDFIAKKQIKSLVNSKSNIPNMARSKSTNNFRTNTSVPKFYHNQQFVDNKQRTISHHANSQNKKSTSQNPIITVQNGMRKIIISKDVVKSIKGRSSSTSKLKSQVYRYDLNNRQDSKMQKQANSIKNFSQRDGIKSYKQIKNSKKAQNIIINNILRQNLRGSYENQHRNIISNHNSTKETDIDSLLKKKLNVSNKTNQNKIIII